MKAYYVITTRLSPGAALQDQLLQQQRLPLLPPVAVRHLQGIQDARADRERVHHRAAAAALLHRAQRALWQQAVRDAVPLREGAAQRQGEHVFMEMQVH